MKVAHIFKTYFPDTQGGLEEAIRQIAKYTTAKGVENKIFTVSPSPESVPIQFEEAEVFQAKVSLDIFSTPLSFGFLKNLKEIEKCDIMHFHFPWPFSELIFLTRQKKNPWIVTYHADVIKYSLLKLIMKPLIHKFLSKTDAIVPTSRSFLDSSPDLACFKEKCKIIPLSIGEDRFIQDCSMHKGKEGAILDEIKAEVGTGFFLFVGVLREYKGLEYLIKAMDGLPQKLVIIGKGSNRHKLERLSEKLGLNNVIFAGYLDDMHLQAHLKLCRALVLPSINRSEAFGVTLLEACQFSKPMISTELGTGTSYVNKNGKTGIVIPPKDITALKNAMTELLDDSLCKIYGGNARERYEKKFTPDRMGSEYMKIYKGLLSKQ